MKKLTMLLMSLIPLFVSAQTSKGIQFQDCKNWKTALRLAKESHKNIFIDAFATWCVPCKMMDAEVYTNPQVADFVNRNFLAIRIQFDQTNKDPEQIKSWYADAKYLMDFYHVQAFPTYLFISSEGQLIQKNTGFQNAPQFLSILKDAIDPNKNFAGQVQLFHEGKLPQNEILRLAMQAKDYQDDSLAVKIARYFKKLVIDKSPPKTLLNDDLPRFIMNFHNELSVNDPLIKFMYENPMLADSMMHTTGYAQRVVDGLIANDLIDPVTKPNGKPIATSPDWAALGKEVSKRYGSSTANRILLNSKIGWYSAKEDWPNIIKYNIEKFDREGLDTTGIASVGINNFCYDVIFQHADDTYALNKAISYMEVILKNNPSSHAWVDTYANLLYKIGKQPEAIQQEEKALTIARKENDGNIEVYKETLKKMRDKLPTWRN